MYHWVHNNNNNCLWTLLLCERWTTPSWCSSSRDREDLRALRTSFFSILLECHRPQLNGTTSSSAAATAAAVIIQQHLAAALDLLHRRRLCLLPLVSSCTSFRTNCSPTPSLISPLPPPLGALGITRSRPELETLVRPTMMQSRSFWIHPSPPLFFRARGISSSRRGIIKLLS